MLIHTIVNRRNCRLSRFHLRACSKSMVFVSLISIGNREASRRLNAPFPPHTAHSAPLSAAQSVQPPGIGYPTTTAHCMWRPPLTTRSLDLVLARPLPGLAGPPPAPTARDMVRRKDLLRDMASSKAGSSARVTQLSLYLHEQGGGVECAQWPQLQCNGPRARSQVERHVSVTPRIG